MNSDLYQMVEGRHGRFLANPNDLYMGRSMIAYGEFSEHEWILLDQLTQPGDVVIEAGSNMGSFTVPLAQKVGRKGLVYAFEPQLIIFQQMCANLALNGLVNVQAFNAGCGSAPGWLPIKRPNPEREINFGGISLERLEAEKLETKVRIETLDEALDPPKLSLIKADVEGMEAPVLKGASGLISEFRPLLYLEAHDPKDTPELFRTIFGMDYRIYWHLPAMFNPKNFFGKPDDIFGNVVSKNVLCVPAERSIVMKGGQEVTDENDHPRTWRKRAKTD